MEEKLKLSPFITNVMLYGANKPYNVALVVPDADTLKEWTREKGIKFENAATDPQVRELLAAELERFGTDFKSYEKPRKLMVTLDDFTTENGLLTPSLKLKRDKVLEKYQGQLDALYD